MLIAQSCTERDVQITLTFHAAVVTSHVAQLGPGQDEQTCITPTLKGKDLSGHNSRGVGLFEDNACPMHAWGDGMMLHALRS